MTVQVSHLFSDAACHSEVEQFSVRARVKPSVKFRRRSFDAPIILAETPHLYSPQEEPHRMMQLSSISTRVHV